MKTNYKPEWAKFEWLNRKILYIQVTNLVFKQMFK